VIVYAALPWKDQEVPISVALAGQSGIRRHRTVKGQRVEPAADHHHVHALAGRHAFNGVA
jgi:acid stress-induced BolA-like protein IbaG/YrbA